MLQLRPYQERAKHSVYEHLRARHDNPCVVIPTAGGKTPVMASICKDAVGQWDGRVLILAHVKELLEQATDKLRAVCPEIEFGVYSAGLKRRDTRNPVIVAGIQSVYRRACELESFDLVMVDECFVAGTLVTIPSGKVPIEQVQPGMFVCHALGVDRVVATSARQTDELFTLEYSDGTTITCTPNHPIFTNWGWMPAGAMELGSLAFSLEDMRMLRQRVSTLDQTPAGWKSDGSERKTLDEAAILFNLLFEDPQQLHAIGGGPQEGQPNHEDPGTLTARPRRQWSAYPTSEEAVGATRDRMACGIFNSCFELQDPRAAQESQDRLGKSLSQDRDRTGRAQSPIAKTQVAGYAEDDLPGSRRLVRVSRHERARGQIVFNLHVAGHPSYFANGVLVHNCHLIPEEGEGMYRQFLAEAKIVNPALRIAGFTATPFRLKTGPICTPVGFLNHVCFEVGVCELIHDGFLCPLRTKTGINKADFDRLHVRGGEFVADEVEDLMDDARLVEAACGETVGYAGDRKAVLIFASGIKHGQHIVRVLAEKHNIDCGFVTGETPTKQRDSILGQFRRGELKYLCNVNVLTTGFDAPNIDCVALVRPTMSPGLYYQMVGRGFRLHDGKKDCLVLDFGGNVLRHGPVDDIRVTTLDRDEGQAPAKECPECQAVIAAGFSKCPQCGYEFPPPERKRHEAKASEAGILSRQVTDIEYEVRDTTLSVHTKRNALSDAPRTMRVDYRLGLNHWQSEFICFEHDGYARQKAVGWWTQRSPDPVPDTAERAVEIAQSGDLARTERIAVRSVAGEKYDRVVAYKLGPLPEAIPASEFAGYDPDDIPF